MRILSLINNSSNISKFLRYEKNSGANIINDLSPSIKIDRKLNFFLLKKMCLLFNVIINKKTDRVIKEKNIQDIMINIEREMI